MYYTKILQNNIILFCCCLWLGVGGGEEGGETQGKFEMPSRAAGSNDKVGLEEEKTRLAKGKTYRVGGMFTRWVKTWKKPGKNVNQ